MNRLFINNRSEAKRRGSLMPAIAIALLVVGAGAALVLNSLWIDAAKVELRNAAEASALAAAGEYLGDHLLLENIDYDFIAEQAHQRAASVALSNTVAGSPLELNVDAEEKDVYFGYKHTDIETGEAVFLESNSEATGVVVRAQRTRQIGTPIHMFLSGVTDQPEADAIVYAEVSFDNVIDHFRPTRALPIPAIPLAILASDPQGKRTDTWDVQITKKLGADRYRFDEQTHEIIEQPDGIVEMELRSVPLNTDPLQTNVQLLDFNNELSEQKVSEQIQKGLNFFDLELLNEILPAQRSFAITGNANITTPVQISLESQIGQQRLCVLYTSQAPITVPGWSNLECQHVVAVRIMKVIPESNESATIIIQPTVMTTKTAALVRFEGTDQIQKYETTTHPVQFYTKNPFVYKMFISQ